MKKKITKKQLKKIIEQVVQGPDLGRGKDFATGGSGKGKAAATASYDEMYYDLVDDYYAWAEQNGHVTPSASSVMASYFLEKGLEDDHKRHKMLGKAFMVAHSDIMADIRRQKAERAATMGESKMKITRRQLRQIIREEKGVSFERSVKTSLVNVLVSEGLVPNYQVSILNEARLVESDADMKALEDQIVAQAKKAGAYGKIGLKALSAFIKPIANQAAAVAKGAGKFLGAAAGGLTTGIKDLLGGVKDEKDLRKLAEEKPEEFKKIHSGYVEKFKAMGLPVSDAASAAAFIGVSETDDGRAAVEAAAKKGGISLDDLNSQLNFFGQMVKHLDTANKAAAGVKSENNTVSMKITKGQLRALIHEAMADEPIRQIAGDSFPPEMLKTQKRAKSTAGAFKDTIIMSPSGDALLVGGKETALQGVVRELEVQSGESIPARIAGDINAKLLKQMGEGYVEVPISWSPATGWKF